MHAFFYYFALFAAVLLVSRCANAVRERGTAVTWRDQSRDTIDGESKLFRYHVPYDAFLSPGSQSKLIN